MRILLNGLSLHQPLSGIGWYTDQLGKYLSLNPEVDEIIYWGHIGMGNRKYVDREFKSIDSVRGKPFASLRLLTKLHARGFIRRMLHRRWNVPNTIYHETNFIPRTWDYPTIITIHDLSILRFPEFHPIERVNYIRKHLYHAVENTGHILADTEFVKQEILDTFSISEKKVTVTALGVRTVFRPRSPQELSQTLDKYKLKNQEFLLITGSFEPRKNLLNVVRAFKNLPNSLRQNIKLVHVGPDGWENSQATRECTDLISSGQMLRLGYLSDKELAELYAAATVFLFPSIYEGFGLPIVESMASGTPVITSRGGAMEETAGKAALLVDANDTDSIQSTMMDLLEDTSLQNQLIELGIDHASKFTWQKCADKTFKVYSSF